MGAVASPPGAVAQESVISPATLKPLASVAIASAAEVDAALHAARAARRDWQGLGGAERARALREFARLLRSRTTELARLASQETGRAIRETQLATELAATEFEHPAIPGASNAGRPGERLAQGPPWPLDDRCDAVLLALGQDCSLHDWARVVAPVLAAGWPVVSIVAASASLTMDAICSTHALGVPGVLQCLKAASTNWPDGLRAAERTLALRVEPGAVRRLDEPAAGPIERQACFIAADANLEAAVAEVVAARLRDAGQCPGQHAQVFVDLALVDRATDRLHECMAFLEAGDPDKPATQLGPVRSAARMREVEDLVAQVLRLRLRLILGGLRYQPWGLRGYFFQPTLFVADHGPDARIPDYLPGPVVILTPVRGPRELGTHLGSRGGHARVRVFSADPVPVQREIEAAGGDARP